MVKHALLVCFEIYSYTLFCRNLMAKQDLAQLGFKEKISSDNSLSMENQQWLYYFVEDVIYNLWSKNIQEQAFQMMPCILFCNRWETQAWIWNGKPHTTNDYKQNGTRSLSSLLKTRHSKKRTYMHYQLISFETSHWEVW